MKPPIQVEMPDGRKVEFPADTPKEVMEKALREFASPPSASLKDWADTIRLTSTGAAQGLAEVGDLAKSIMGPPPAMPKGIMPGGPVGDIIKRGGLGGTGLAKALNVPSNVDAEAKRLGAEMTPLRKALSSGAKVAAGTAIMGGGTLGTLLAGTGAGLGQNLGGDTGELIGSIAAPLAGMGVAKALAPKAPTIGDLETKKRALYSASEKAGAIVRDRAYGQAVNKIGDEVEKIAAFGNPILAPKSGPTLGMLEKSVGQHVTLEGLDSLRRTVSEQIGEAARQGAKTDVMLLQKMKDGLDDLFNGLNKGTLVQGDEKAVKLLKEARAVSQRLFKSEAVDDTIKLAGTRAASPDLALRNEFATLARRLEKQGWAGFSAAEKEAIEQMVKPSGMRRLIRAMGYAPLFVPGYGEAGKELAARMATKKAASVSELMRRGGPQPTQAISEELRRAMMLGGATSAAGN